MVKKNLIFIPGLGYSSNIWRKLVRYIPKEKYNIHLLDIPNYASLYKGWPLNFPHFGTWLSDILLEKRVKPPYILVGHSLGGYISLEYAIKNKNKVDKLIIISSPLRNPSSPSPLNYKLTIWFGCNSQIIRNVIKFIISRKNKLLKKIVKHLSIIDPSFLIRCDIRSVALCCHDLLNHDWPKEVRNEAENLNHKVLFVYGTKDSAITKTRGTELYKEFKNAKTISFPCNHSIPIHYPKKLAGEIIKFIED